jgi:hypothetical protein
MTVHHPDDGSCKHLCTVRKFIPDYATQRSRRLVAVKTLNLNCISILHGRRYVTRDLRVQRLRKIAAVFSILLSFEGKNIYSAG